MVRWKKAWMKTLAVVTAIALMAGCGNSGSTSSDSKNAENAAAGGGKEQVTLQMVESLTSPARTQLLNEMIKRFESKNPGINVELISPPLESADQKISSMLLAKQDVDVLEVRDQTVKQFVQNKFLADLSADTGEWQHWDSLIDTVKSNATIVDNKPYFIPYGIYQKTLFYRTDWFKEKGLQPPKTWEELLDAAVKLTDPSKNRYGYSFRGGAGSPDYVEFMTWAYLGDKLAPNDSYFTKDGKTMYETAEAKQALQMFMDLYKKASPPDSISWSYPEMVQGFTSGVTAMLIQDPEVIQTAKEKMQEGTWDTAPLPLGPSGFAPQTVGTAGWGIAEQSEHKEEAWKLIEFLSSPEENLGFSKSNGLIPIHKSAAEDPYFKDGFYKSYMAMNAEPERYLTAQRPVGYKGWGQFRSNAEKEIQAYLFGKTTADDLLKTWAAYWADQKKNQ